MPVFMPKKRKSPEDFWREYEEKTGEKVISNTLGQYVSGWEEFGDMRGNPLWGLIIATSGGFRFHHFPQSNWLTALFNSDSDEAPKEKTIFIPSDRIISAVLQKETKWYKKIFSPVTPRLVIRYRDEAGSEKELIFLAEYKTDGLKIALGVSE